MIKFIQKWFLGWLGLYVYNTRARHHPVIDAFMSRFLRIKPTITLSANFITKYEHILGRTRYWHGTGKYQYDPSGLIIDKLTAIQQMGGLVPSSDVFDLDAGTISSISCSEIRIYARIYADMHECGGAHTQRCGAAFMWGYYFIVSSALKAIFHMRLWVNIRKRHEIARQTKADMRELWIRKVRRTRYNSLKELFVSGSDIKNNFAILIALKDMNSPIASAPYISMHETRTMSHIPLENWSHVEVPYCRVDELEHMFAELHLNIPVFPLEDCEAYWARKSFTHLALTPYI